MQLRRNHYTSSSFCFLLPIICISSIICFNKLWNRGWVALSKTYEITKKCTFELDTESTAMHLLILVHRWSFLGCTKLQCWSESGLVSPTVSPSPQGQSPSPSPTGQSPSPSGVSPSPLDQSPRSKSKSIGPESESESSGSESESESGSPTKVRVSPDLSPDSAWTHESNNRKVFYYIPTFNHFCWALYWYLVVNLNFPLFVNI